MVQLPELALPSGQRLESSSPRAKTCRTVLAPDSPRTTSVGFTRRFEASAQLHRSLSETPRRPIPTNGSDIKVEPPQKFLTEETPRMEVERMPNLVYHTPCEPDVLERVHAMREAFLLMGKNMHLEAIDDFDDKVDKQSEKLKEDVRALCKEWSNRAQDKDTEIEGAIRPYEGKDKRSERVDQLRAAGGIKNLDEADQLEQEIKGTHRMLLIDTDMDGMMALLNNLLGMMDNRLGIAESLFEDITFLEEGREGNVETWLKSLKKKMEKAAYKGSGEIQRIIEEVVTTLMHLQLDNQLSVEVLRSKVNTRAVEMRKDLKKRWEDIYLEWRKVKHQHVVAECMRNFTGDLLEPFVHPPQMANQYGILKNEQREAHKRRVDLVIRSLKLDASRDVNQAIEEITLLQEGQDDKYDKIFQDMGKCKKEVVQTGNKLQTGLTELVKIYDAREEWTGSGSAKGFVKKNVKPKCDNAIEQWIQKVGGQVATEMQALDVSAQRASTAALKFMAEIRTAAENYRRAHGNLHIDLDTQLEDMKDAHAQACQAAEDKMNSLEVEMQNAPSTVLLKDARARAYATLEDMAVMYRAQTAEVCALYDTFMPRIEAMFAEHSAAISLFLGYFPAAAFIPAPEEGEEKPKPALPKILDGEAYQLSGGEVGCVSGLYVPVEPPQEEGDVVDGTSKILDGTSKILDGTSKILDGTSKMFDGTSKMFDGASKRSQAGIQDGIQGSKASLAFMRENLEAFKEALYLNVATGATISRRYVPTVVRERTGSRLDRQYSTGSVLDGTSRRSQAGIRDGESRRSLGRSDTGKSEAGGKRKSSVGGAGASAMQGMQLPPGSPAAGDAGEIADGASVKPAGRWAWKIAGEKDYSVDLELRDDPAFPQTGFPNTTVTALRRLNLLGGWALGAFYERTPLRARLADMLTESQVAEDDDEKVPEAAADAAEDADADAEGRAADAAPQKKAFVMPVLVTGEDAMLFLELPWHTDIEQTIQDVLELTLADMNETYVKDVETTTERVRSSKETEILELDTRLQKHITRRGKVEIEWYQPRQFVIERHAEKFQRHLQNCNHRFFDLKLDSHDDLRQEFEAPVKELEAALEEIEGSLGGCRNLAELLSKSIASKQQGFKSVEQLRRALEHAESLVRAFDTLRLKNNDYCDAIRIPDEKYSQLEIQAYTEELETLNAQLAERKAEFKHLVEELRDEMSQRKDERIEQFEENYHQAVEDLSAREGLGPVHGAARRAVQETIRTGVGQIWTSVGAVERVIGELEEFLSFEERHAAPARGCLHQHPDLPSDLGRVLEARGTFAICGTMVRSCAQYMGVLEQSWPSVNFFSETDWNGEEDTERCKTIVEEVTVMNSQFSKDKFEQLVADAKSSAGKGDKLPEYMISYFEMMDATLEETTESVRAKINELLILLHRTTGLLPGILTHVRERYDRELDAFFDACRAALEAAAEQSRAERHRNEQELRPELRSVLKLPQLDALCTRELYRHNMFMAALKACRAKVTEALPGLLYDGCSSNLVGQFESLVYLLDLVPLPEEVVPLKRPADEKKRVSIKRLYRKSSCAARPPRTWEGLDFRIPIEDWEVEEPEEYTSAEIESFRTDVHKALFRQRQENFDAYKALLQRRAKDCADLLRRLEVEEDKAIWHWDHMLVQLEAPDQVRHFKDGKTTEESNDNGDEPA